MTNDLKTTPKVAFVIVCWNNVDLLAECFESIDAQSYGNHVTVMLDNGSKDNSIEFTENSYPWVDVVAAGENLGFAAGNNRAIERALKTHADTQYVVFLNTDARIDKDWLATLVAFAGKKPKGALFQGTTLDYYDRQIVDSTHVYISRNGSGTQAGWRQPYLGIKGPRKVFGVNAAAAMISRSYIAAQPFEKLFDETMFMYLEDVDLSARATVMGWDNYLVPGAVAFHMGSASSSKRPGFSLYLTYRNNTAVLLKNLPTRTIIKMVPHIILADFHTIKHLRKSGRGRLSSNIIKGRLIGSLRLPLYIPAIHKLAPYRRSISREFMWNIMKIGEL